MPQILVIDDDRTVLRFAQQAFADSDVRVQTASSAAEGMEAISAEMPDVVLLDVMLPQISGLELAAQVRSKDPKLPIIFITAADDSDTAIEAMKMGAYDYLLKPLDMANVQSLVHRALTTRRLMQVPVKMVDTGDSVPSDDVLVGRSPQMLNVYKEIGRVAAQDVTVLIRGESGTGKELVARAIYQHSNRNQQTFMAVNCAALSETLLESELFGHEKGAFTGADRRKIGKFEQCNGGTLFLDEIGDMSPLVQSKVLRLLQEQSFERLGGTETIRTNVRIISATNRDLNKMVDEGQFRLDLYHRLNGFEIRLPPLKDRTGDVQLLLEHYLARLRQQLNKDVEGISPEAMERLLCYAWPGNVRELQNVLRRTLLKSAATVIVPDFLPDELLAGQTATAAAADEHDADMSAYVSQRRSQGSNNLYAETLEFMERYLLVRVLRDCDGNQSKAAERLGITRGSLRHKIRALGITIGQVVSSDEDGDE
jgi:nitrogen regulation protein NR(I)